MALRFLLFGLFGWCTEIVFTALYGLGEALVARRRVDWALPGTSYLWMLPIYGGGGLLFERAYAVVAELPWPVRGGLYMIGCFVVEYTTGLAIKLVTGKIPWDYSHARFHLHGLIRWDYAPAWFAFGLVLEKVMAWIHAIAQVL